MNSILEEEDIKVLEELGLNSMELETGQESDSMIKNEYEALFIDDKFYFKSESDLAIGIFFILGMVLSVLFAIYYKTYSAPVFFGLLLVLKKNYNVIDFKNKIIYNKIYFGIFPLFKIQVIEESNIVEVGNNIVAQELLPYKWRDMSWRKITKHPDTGYYHKYYLSFLLKNGKIYNFIPFGFYDVDYYKSIKLAMLLSKYWNKPLTICPNDLNLINNNGKLDTFLIEQPNDEIKFDLTIGILAYILIMGYIIMLCLGLNK